MHDKEYKSDMDGGNLTCLRCGVPLVNSRVTFRYLGRSFSAEVPHCEICGQVYISRELARGKMAEVEKMLEDK